jgi:hypothetical protein
MFQRMSGGSNETELKLFAVMPRGEPSLAQQVTTVTPVANCPRLRRSSSFLSALRAMIAAVCGDPGDEAKKAPLPG